MNSNTETSPAGAGVGGIHPAVIALVAAVVAACGFAVWSMTRGPSAPGASQGLASSTPAEAARPGNAPMQSTAGAPHEAARHPAPAHVATAPAVCRECGRVESVTMTERAGEGTGLGAVAGGVLGGVVGHQFGGGSGRDVATIVGAAGGAFAGHQVEKKVRSVKTWHVNVRMDDGTLRTFDQATAPTIQNGEPVRVIDGRVVPSRAAATPTG